MSAKNQKCWKNESTWVSQKRSCVKNNLGDVRMSEKLGCLGIKIPKLPIFLALLLKNSHSEYAGF